MFVFAQLVLPHYRLAAFRVLFERVGSDLCVLTGTHHFDPALATVVDPALPMRLVNNRYLLGRRLAIQTGSIRAAVAAEVAVVDLNPRILTGWLILLVRRFLRRPTVVWGHAWPRAGSGARTAKLRRRFRGLADAIVTYTESEAEELRALGERSVFAAPNALYRAGEMHQTFESVAVGETGSSTLIYVGRLIRSKRVDTAIEAIAHLRDRGRYVALTIVGDGPEKEALLDLSQRLAVADDVRFIDATSDAAVLRRLYADAMASVCPGPVGLAVVQSLGFGRPIIFPRDAAHGPEREALKEDWNSVAFEQGNSRDLAHAVEAIAADRDTWRGRSGTYIEECRRLYSAEAMAAGLVAARDRVRRYE